MSELLERFRKAFRPESKEIAIPDGEIWISKNDFAITNQREFELKPESKVSFRFHPGDFKGGVGDLLSDPKSRISLRSILALGGINVDTVHEGSEVTITLINLNPYLTFKFPEGVIKIGRVYKTGNPLVGEPVKTLADQLRKEKFFGIPAEAEVMNDREGKPLSLAFPLHLIHYQMFIPKEDVDVSSLPSGKHRWELEGLFGVGIEPNPFYYKKAVKHFPSDFKIANAPIIKLPDGVCLLITNPAHSESRIVDSGFEHILAAEFKGEVPEKLICQVFRPKYI